jgi:hypothetical protein
MLPPSCIPQDLLFTVARIGAESAVGRPLSRPIVVLRNYQLHSATIARADRIASALLGAARADRIASALPGPAAHEGCPYRALLDARGRQRFRGGHS